MRRIIAIALSLFLLPQFAQARCAGNDLLAELKKSDPAAHEEMFQRAKAVRNGRGKFWRISYEGMPRSYLYGTFHDTEIARTPLKPAVEGSLMGARILMVELTKEEQERLEARMSSDPDFVIDRNGGGLISHLSAEERATAEKALAARGVPLAVADKLRAPILFSLLTVPHCILADMQAGNPTLDELIRAKAAKKGLPIAGLETYEQAIGSVSAIPKPIMNTILLEALRDLSGEEDVRRTTVELYQDAEIAAIWEFSVQHTAKALGMENSRQIMDALAATMLEARNRAWIEKMVPELQKGGVFAAFGAMHLVGQSGIVELLRDRGFEVIRLDG